MGSSPPHDFATVPPLPTKHSKKRILDGKTQAGGCLSAPHHDYATREITSSTQLNDLSSGRCRRTSKHSYKRRRELRPGAPLRKSTGPHGFTRAKSSTAEVITAERSQLVSVILMHRTNNVDALTRKCMPYYVRGCRLGRAPNLVASAMLTACAETGILPRRRFFTSAGARPSCRRNLTFGACTRAENQHGAAP